MGTPPTILALETSCDETAVAILRGDAVLASEISSQIDVHSAFGGVVPEVASRQHLIRIRPLLDLALKNSGLSLQQIDAFAATAGPGLASSLLVGNTFAKALALAIGKPYLAVNHMEGHLLSPFLGDPDGVRPCVALIVSGGHTLLLHLRGVGDYRLLGRTRDDAAGEAFDKIGKMLGLPYPGGPAIDKMAAAGHPQAFDFPRVMLHSGDCHFSFSGLKTAVLYAVEKLPQPLDPLLPDLCASVQAAIVDVLIAKTLLACQITGENTVAVSGGVACNSALRKALAEKLPRHGIQPLLARPALTTDNAAMIAYVASLHFSRGISSPLNQDIDPNLALAT